MITHKCNVRRLSLHAANVQRRHETKDKGDICPNSERAEILNKSLLHPLMFGF